MISAIRIFAVVALAAAASAEPRDTLTNAGLQGAPLRRIRSAMGRTNPDRARRQAAGSGGGSGDSYFTIISLFPTVDFNALIDEQASDLATQIRNAYCTAVPDSCDGILSVTVQAAGQAGRRNRRQTGGTEGVIRFQSSVTTAPDAPALTVENIAVGTGVVASATSAVGTVNIVTGMPTVSPTPAPVSDRLTTASPYTGGKGGEGGKGTKGMGGEGGKGTKGMGGEGGKGMGEGGSGKGMSEGGRKGHGAQMTASFASKVNSPQGVGAMVGVIALVAGTAFVSVRRARNRAGDVESQSDETTALVGGAPSPAII